MSLLSVYLVTYNRLEYLKKAVEGVLNQTYKDFDFFILDNCSTDGTKEYIESINDKRIRYIRHEKNIGNINNINYAFENSTSDYFVILHDDDIVMKDFVSKNISFLQKKSNIDCLTSSAILIDRDGNIINDQAHEGLYKEFKGSEYFTNYFSKLETFVFPTAFYKNSFIKKYSIKLNKLVGPSCDVIVFSDIERFGGTVASLPDKLIYYRIHPGQDSIINSISKHLQLYTFVKSDSYYSSLYKSIGVNENSKSQSYCKRNIIEYLQGRISYGEMCKNFKQIELLFQMNIIYYVKFKLTSLLFKLFPNTSKLFYNKCYRLLKNDKRI